MNEINRGTLCALALYGAQRVRPQHAFDYEVAKRAGLVSLDPNVTDAQRYTITDAGRAHLDRTRVSARVELETRKASADAADDLRAQQEAAHELAEFDRTAWLAARRVERDAAT